MTKRYLIHCCAGPGGLFLTSVFAKIMNIDIDPQLSSTGHCHDQGHGAWRGAPGVTFVANHWQLNYRPGSRLYYVHELDPLFRAENPDVEFVKITAQPEDYHKITELYVKKAWPDIWTQEEYAKWASPDYPPYSVNNIADSELICSDLINDFTQSITAAWFERNQHQACDYTVDFRTIMGLDDQDLDQVVADIVGLPTNNNIHQFVVDYQTLNKKLYFNAG